MRLLKALVAFALICGVPARVGAQPREGWDVSVVPMYFWATALDGNLSAGPATVPIFLEFADAADNLGGAYAFHFEAFRGRWGVLSDLNFVRLSSSSTFTLAGRPIEGEFELDNVIFELGASYLVEEETDFGFIGGLRTYTQSPTLAFRAPNSGATPIDTSATSPNGFVGFFFNPRINDRWSFVSRADVGAGDATFTWSALMGFEFAITSWGALEFGYKALGIDVRNDERTVREYDATHYGPIVGFQLRWKQ